MFDWAKKFPSGRDAVENESHERRPRSSVTDENILAVRELVQDDRRLTVVEISSKVGISIGSAHTILSEYLGYHKAAYSSLNPR